MQDLNLIKLKDIAEWNNNGDWVGWNFLQPPPHLQKYYVLFYSYIHGISPSSSRSHNTRGWGKLGFYIFKEGLKMLKSKRDWNQKRLWKKVYNFDHIPKVNIFVWLLVKNNLLSANNLRKRGFQGPSRCSLCSSKE